MRRTERMGPNLPTFGTPEDPLGVTNRFLSAHVSQKVKPQCYDVGRFPK